MASFRKNIGNLFSLNWKLTLFLYAFLMAVIVLILKIIEYKYLVRQLNIEVYIGLVALLFSGIGVWIGLKLVKEKNINSKPELKNIQELGISKREYEVLQHMAKGLSNQQIADQLFISLPTVKTHSSNLFIKLDVKRRTQAVLKAKKLRLID